MLLPACEGDEAEIDDADDTPAGHVVRSPRQTDDEIAHPAKTLGAEVLLDELGERGVVRDLNEEAGVETAFTLQGLRRERQDQRLDSLAGSGCGRRCVDLVQHLLSSQVGWCHACLDDRVDQALPRPEVVLGRGLVRLPGCVLHILERQRRHSAFGDDAFRSVDHCLT